MKRLLFVLLACFVLSAGSSAKTFYITHVAASAAWETNLILTNAIGPDTEAFVVLVDAAGDEITTIRVPLDPGETRVYDLQAYGAAAGYVTCASDYVTVRVGFVASEGSGGGTAEFALATELSDSEVLDLSNYYDQLTWAGFALLNGSDQTVSVTPRYITANGISHFGTSFNLDPWEKRVAYFEDALGEPFTNLTAVIFETDSKALTAITISGKENEKLLFTRSTPTSSGWEVVDTYFHDPVTSVDFNYIGQILTPYGLYYLVTCDEIGYPFRNRLRKFDKWTGEFTQTMDFGPDFEARGIITSNDTSSFYVYGIEDDKGSGRHYYIYQFNKSSGALLRGLQLSSTTLSNNHNKSNIYAATTGGTVTVAMQTNNTTIVRHLLPEDLSGYTDIVPWTTDAILSDILGDDGQYYLFYTVYSPADNRYCTVSIYQHPYNSLSGTEYARTYSGMFGYDATDLLTGGAFMDGDIIRTRLKGNTVKEVMLYKGLPAYLYRLDFITSSSGFSLVANFWGIETTMDADISICRGPHSTLYYWVSNFAQTRIFNRDREVYRVVAGQVIDPTIDGDDLYIVDYQRQMEGGLEMGDGLLHKVRVRKMSFLDFITSLGR